jgi:hypothetical protein
VLGLSGDLGAGKTQLVKGLAQGLGISDRVRSPSFGLVNEYGGGRCPLFHLDLCRLEDPMQIRVAGLEEYLFDPRGVTAVEWFERWLEVVQIGTPSPGSDAFGAGLAALRGGWPGLRWRWVWIEMTGGDERRLRYEDAGA